MRWSMGLFFWINHINMPTVQRQWMQFVIISYFLSDLYGPFTFFSASAICTWIEFEKRENTKCIKAEIERKWKKKLIRAEERAFVITNSFVAIQMKIQIKIQSKITDQTSHELVELFFINLLDMGIRRMSDKQNTLKIMSFYYQLYGYNKNFSFFLVNENARIALSDVGSMNGHASDKNRKTQRCQESRRQYLWKCHTKALLMENVSSLTERLRFK